MATAYTSLLHPLRARQVESRVELTPKPDGLNYTATLTPGTYKVHSSIQPAVHLGKFEVRLTDGVFFKAGAEGGTYNIAGANVELYRLKDLTELAPIIHKVA
jgi:hypothetical protein